jgi:F-type H+-transporting ATPase subunit delta
MNAISLHDYATAFIASISSEVDAVKEIDTCVESILSVKSLRAFLNDVSVPLQTRRDALETAFPKAAAETLNLIVILARDERLDELASLTHAVRDAVAAKQGKRHARVSSVVPLSSAQRKRIEEALQEIIGHPVELETHTDATLLAGLHVSVGDWTFDASTKGRLDRLQQAIS